MNLILAGAGDVARQHGLRAMAQQGDREIDSGDWIAGTRQALRTGAVPALGRGFVREAPDLRDLVLEPISLEASGNRCTAG